MIIPSCGAHELRFLVEAQLPPALARRLDALGHNAEHVADCGLLSATDEVIRAYAASRGAVIVTKDDDFVVHHPVGQRHGRER
jgi:predicted nuclease of predicted toxin-antitoxin system